MKKFVALLMTMLLMLSLAAVQTAASSEESADELPTYHFKFSIPQVEGDPAYVSAEKFIQMVEEETDGNITFDFYPAGELGGMQDILEQVMRGSDIVTLTGADWMGSVVSDYAVTNPYVVTDPADFTKLYESEWFQGKMEEASGLGIKILDPNWFAGYRSFLTTFPITTPADLSGKKIRVLNNELLSNIMICFDAVPVGLELSESYTAMQNGLLDGIEGVPATLWSTKFYESGAKYCTATHHSAAFCVAIINQDIYDGMPAEYQEILVNAAKVCGEEYSAVNVDKEEEYFEMLEGEGVEVVRDPDLTPFIEATKDVPSMMPTWSDNVADLMAEAIAG